MRIRMYAVFKKKILQVFKLTLLVAVWEICYSKGYLKILTWLPLQVSNRFWSIQTSWIFFIFLSFDFLIQLTFFCPLQLKKNIFRRSRIVGKRFPICLLKMRDSVIEVCSSYYHHGHMSFLATHSLFFICSNRFRAFEQLLIMGIEVKW